ncbi:MAG TPA: hypothetical protein VEL51_16270 [Vicinamibacterales bacterium]|nr:hypothetical protein [Vicinamibacterales bacterium]
MRRVHATTFAIVTALSLASVSAQQPPSGPPAAGGQRMGGMDAARKVPGGGIFAPGWKGKIDAEEVTAGGNVNDSKFEMKGSDITIASGPASIFWNPANTQSGDYTVSATFTEPQYMSSNSHPHPYGVFIGGNKLDTDQATLLYCAAYGNGTYIVRGFGPASFAPNNNRRPTANDAVHKAGDKGQPVTQEIKMSVKGSRVSCSINGTEVASFDKGDLTGAGKLESVEGIAGIRAAHNVDVKVTNFKVEKQ